MKLKDITSWEKEQKPENENKYIPGSSEKKRASMMYLFFGIFVSLSKKEFNPFELYHLKQAIGLWTLLLPIVLISFIPIIKWIWVFVLAILLWILAASFVNAFNWKYFDDSKNAAFTLPAGIWGWFLDLFELWIKSTWVDSEKTDSNQASDTSSEIEKDIAENSNETTLDSLQTKETSLEEDVQTLDKEKESSDDVENK